MLSTYCVLVVLSALFTSGLSSLIEWVLIYNTDDYIDAEKNLSKLKEKLKIEKQRVVKTIKTKKAIEKLNEKIDVANRDMAGMKFKSMILIGVIMVSFLGFLNQLFDGRVVAKLPFEPFNFLQGITHRNLMGEDYTDCGMIFIYILSNIYIRANIQKLLGIQPDGQGFFTPPSSMTEDKDE